MAFSEIGNYTDAISIAPDSNVHSRTKYLSRFQMHFFEPNVYPKQQIECMRVSLINSNASLID